MKNLSCRSLLLNKRIKILAFIVLSAFLSFNAMTSDSFAATPFLVKDINTRSAGSSPQNLANINGTLFFSANTGTTGWELIKSDGTTTGTVLVKDIYPGLASSSPAGFVQLGGFTYFAASDGVNGRELWRTDGTESGTTLFMDINPGSASSNPGQFTVLGGAILFTADDGVNGTELWSTDGTTAVLLKDINPGGPASGIQSMRKIGALVYFWADNYTNGLELWTSDGTSGNTQMTNDMNLYPRSSLYDLNGKAIYAALDNYTITGHGVEPFVSDGTAPGTFRIYDITSGYPDGFHGGEFGILNGYAYFMGGDINITGSQNLYRTNGTLNDVANFHPVRLPKNFVTVGTELYFVGYENASDLYSIWKTNGTTATLVASPSTVRYWNHSYPPTNLVDVNGTLYFTSPDSTLEPVYPTTPYLWKSDGVTTVRVTTKVGYPQNLTNVNGILYFSADDGVNGPELWRSDGTDAGTYMLKVNTAGTASTAVAGAVQMNGVYYFTADDGVHGAELWKSDGTGAGTQMVLDIVPGVTGSSVSNLTAVGSTLYFTACDATSGCELWKSDGTAGGTSLVTDIWSGAGGSSPASLTSFKGVLFFTADDGMGGNELWKSDGTSAGTVMVKDIYPGSPYNSSYPYYLTKVNGSLFFAASDGVNGNELWVSDGTTAGTVMVKDIYPGASFNSSDPYNLVNSNGTLFFVASDGVNGFELWKSDGTSSGTMMVKDINAGSFAGSSPSYLTNLNGVLYFTADDGINGIQLWKSDGTDLGTARVTTINPGLFNPEFLTWVNGRLFFRANDGTNGVELWTSDGTTGGTALVKDIFTGAASNSSAPSNLVNVNGRLFFSADDGVHGVELWQSDGTGAGTIMVLDIYVEPLVGSTPNNLVNVQGTLFFFANDGQHGKELMTYQLLNADPPTVVASTPLFGAANVPPGTDIAAVFSEAMDPATINASTFTVSGITGTVAYDGANTAMFIPSSALSYGATYTVTITTGATDAAGTALSTGVTWTFATAQPRLMIAKIGAGTGTITSNIGGISCGATCSAVYNPGDVVTLTATPDAGMAFSGWSGACTGTGSCLVTMNASKTATAAFTNPSWMFIERFDAGTLPAGWQVLNGIWDFNYFALNITGGSGGYAFTNDWNPELYTPVLDLSGMTAPILEFKTDYTGDGFNQNATIQVSVNGGQSWTPVWSPGATSYPGPSTIQVNLSAIAAGQPAVMIRFLLVNYDTGAPQWAIDDVTVFNAPLDTTPPTVQSTSPVNGATNVPVGTAVAASFSEVLNPTTINSLTFFLTGPTGTVSGGVMYSGLTATFTPSLVLASSTTYTATITAGVRDAAGNALAAPAIWSFTTADVIPPVTTASPAGGLFNVMQTVTLTSSEPATIYYTTDGSTPTRPATGSTLASANTATIAVNRNMTIRFFSADLAGNVEPVTNSAVYTIDMVAPITTAAPAGGFFASGPTVTLTSNEPATIRFTLNGSDPILSSPTYTAPIFVSGPTTTLKFFAIDLAGNVEPVRTEVYTIDPDAPRVDILWPVSSRFVNTSDVSYMLSKDMATGSVVFTSTSNTVVSQATYTMTAPDLTAGSHTVTGMSLNDGTTYTLTVRVTDSTSRTASATITNVTYDTTSAIITMTSPVAFGRVNSAAVAYTLSEAITAGEIVILEGTTPVEVHPLAAGELSAGSHTVNTQAALVNGSTYTFSIANVLDFAGNPSPTVTVPNVLYDNTAVVITNTAPTTKGIITTPTVTYSLSEQAASGTVTFTRSGGSADPASPHVYTMSGLAAGAYTVTPAFTLVDGTFYTVSFAAMDMAGNASTTVSNAQVFFDRNYGVGPVGNVDNRDGLSIVNNADVIKLQDTLGTRPGDGRWNPVCDLDRNNMVDTRDLMILHTHYGQTGP